MKTGFLITARLKSTRLPEKLLREVEGKAIFSHMIDRLKLAKRVDEIIVCTSTNPQDDRLVDLAAAEGIKSFQGDEDDVVKRLSDAASKFELDYILSITADCPFSDPEYADRIVAEYERTGADLIRALDLPHGAYSYGVKPAAYRKVLEIKTDNNSEVWGRYFTDTDLFTVYDLPIDNPLHHQPNLRMTLDYPEDLEFFKAVFAKLYSPDRTFTLDEILEFLKEHPEVVALNRHCATAYKKRWTRQSSIKLKPRYDVQRAAIIGYGSIGRRHLNNLTALGVKEIVALRSGKANQREIEAEVEVSEVTSWDDVLAFKPDVAIISNPTSLHLDAIKQCVPHVRGIFVEKPLLHSLDGLQELLYEIRERKVVTFVGHNLQFHWITKFLQDWLTLQPVGEPLVFQCQVGQWIEDWHPAEDYRQAYYSRRDLGGGAALSLIHEVHLATELLGPAKRVSAFFPESDRLQLDVDVIADFMIEHVSGATSQIHLDLIQKPAHRSGTITCETGWARYDFITQTLTANPEGKPVEQNMQPDADAMAQTYRAEMEAFLDAVREGKVRHEHDFRHATQSLAVVDTARVAAATNSVVELPAWVRTL